MMANPVQTVAYRIWEPIWRDDDSFAALRGWLSSHPEAVDEISLFDGFHNHPGRPLESVRRDAEALEERIRMLRSDGVGSVGVNVIVTLGHGIAPGEGHRTFDPMVGHDGRVNYQAVCFTDPGFGEYLDRYYGIIAGAGPDFIWVDDDFRVVQHGVRYPCFCDRCVTQFRADQKPTVSFDDRSSLVAALDDPANHRLRGQWSQFCADALDRLAGAIREGIRRVDSGIEIGLMTIGYSNSTYGNYPITQWMKTLAATKGRPGHGYYTDDRPRVMVHKTFDSARQVRDYPETVTDVQYELENYPYVTLDKSTRSVMNECATAIMTGCTGVAFNAVYERARNFSEYAPLFAAVAEERRLWRRVLTETDGLPLRGFWPADHRELMARREIGEEGWFTHPEEYAINGPLQIAEMGIPLTVRSQSSVGTLLFGRIAEAFSDEELETILSGGVYLDGEALAVLERRGLGELTGVALGSAVEPAVETLSSHALNGTDAGEGRRRFPGRTRCNLLEPLGRATEVIAKAAGEIDGAELGACMTVYENPRGGRVAVSTYAPWSHLGRAAKKRHLARVFSWLSRGRLEAVIPDTARVWPLVRADEDKAVVMLVNLSLDPVSNLGVELARPFSRAALVNPRGEEELSVATRESGSTVTIPAIKPWHYRVAILTR